MWNPMCHGRDHMHHRRRYRPFSALGAGALLLCVLATGSGPLRADIIRLKTGGVLRGEIIRQDDKTITLRVPYGTMSIEKSHVKSVQKEDALRALLREAAALLTDGRTDAAARKLEEAVGRFPASASAREKLAAVYRRRAAALREAGRSLEADGVYRRILELAPGDDEAAEYTAKVDEIRTSSDAAEKEAWLLVSLGRCREALEIFDRLAVFVPASVERNRKAIAEAHAGYGRRLLEFQRFTEARSHYQKAASLDPELNSKFRREIVIARFSPIVTEINAKGGTLSQARWQALAAELKAIVTLDDDNPHLHYALAVCYHELGQFRDAAIEYGHVTGEKPDLENLPGSLAALQEAAKKKTQAAPIILSFPQGRFTDVRPGPSQILETTHFIIHHHNDELALLMARAAEYFLTRNYKVFLDAMPAKPWPKKCHIYISPSHAEYLKNSRQADWSPAMASTSAVAGELEDHHIMTYQTVEDLLPSHLSHEITHIIHGAVINYTGGSPTWLREGIAVRQEPWWKRIRMAKVIREARKQDNLLKLEEILNQQGYPDGKLVNLFYAQSYALVEALRRAGSKGQFVRFCRQVLDRDALKIIKAVYGLDREALVEHWEKHESDLVSLLDDL